MWHSLHMVHKSLVVFFIVYIIHNENVSSKWIVLTKHQDSLHRSNRSMTTSILLTRVNSFSIFRILLFFFFLIWSQINSTLSLLSLAINGLLRSNYVRHIWKLAFATTVRHAQILSKNFGLSCLLNFFRLVWVSRERLPVRPLITSLFVFFNELA